MHKWKAEYHGAYIFLKRDEEVYFKFYNTIDFIPIDLDVQVILDYVTASIRYMEDVRLEYFEEYERDKVTDALFSVICNVYNVH